MRRRVATFSTIRVRAAFSCMLLSAAAASAPAQRGPAIGVLEHTAWTMREGAPSAVTGLAQSADGVLWIGARGGLYRFDGVRFDSFEAPNSNPLPSLTISALLATADTSLWIGYAAGGVSVFARGRLVSYAQRDGVPAGTITAIARDSAGDIWVATTTGLAQFHAGRWQPYGRENGYPGGMTPDLVVDRRGTLWASTKAGVFTRSRGASQFVRQAPSLDPDGYGLGQPREAPDGSVWGASTKLGLTRLSDSLGRAVPARPSIAQLRQTSAIFVDHRANAWLIDSSGFLRVALAMTRVKPENTASLTVERVPLTTGANANAVFEDREDNIWVATDGGIERFRETKFTPVLLPDPSAVPAIAPGADGSIWLGRYHLPMLAVRDRAVAVARGPSNITSSYRDLTGGVWFGGADGIWHAPPSPSSLGADFARVPLPMPDDVGAADVYAIAQTLSGDLWVSIRGGRMKGVFRRHAAKWSLAPLPAAFSNQIAWTIATDSADRVWLGFPGNRLVLVTGEDSIRVYAEQNGLHVGAVSALLVRGPQLWIGGDLGLTMLNRDGHFQTVTATESLRGITGIVETSDGALWLNGIGGVTAIGATEIRRALDNAAYRAKGERFDYQDGLPGQAPQVRPLPTAIQGTDGRLWFTTERGVAWIDPSNIRRDRLAPALQIRGVKSAGKAYDVGNRIALPARTTDLEVAYTALSFGIPNRVRFRYRLVGADSSWTEAGNRREAFYTNLGPGSYRFQVIAANGDGVWNQTGAGVDVEIPPTFTQTRTFLFLVGAAILGTIWLIALWRQQQIARAEKALGTLRSELARVSRATSLGTLTASIAHEVNQPLSGIVTNASTCLRMLAANPPNVDGARETVRRLIRDSNRAADVIVRLRALFSRTAPTVEPFDLNDAAHEVVALSRSELQRASATVRLELAEDLPPAMGDRIQLQQVIINLLRNACDAMSSVDDRPREIVIQTACGKDNDICLSVRDVGVGFAPETADKLFQAFHTTKHEGMGIGLSVSRSIIESHHGRLWAISNDGPGVTFCFSIPLRPDENLAVHAAERYQSMMDPRSSTGIS